MKESVVFSINGGQERVLDVVFQDAVQLDINFPVRYIRSAEEDIKKYVDETSKPEIAAFTASANAQIVTTSNACADDAEEQIKSCRDVALADIGLYVNETVKPGIDSYGQDVKDDFDDNATAKISEVNQKAAQIAVNAATVAAQAASVEDAVESATAAVSDAQKWAVGTLAEQPAGSAKHWAEIVNASNFLQVNAANLSLDGREAIADIAIESVNLNGLAKTNLSNIAAGLFYGSESGSRYIKFSNGVILQWGAATWGKGNALKLVTLGKAYTSYFRAFAITNSDTCSTNAVVTTGNNGLTGFNAAKSATATSDTESFSWFTIGQ